MHVYILHSQSLDRYYVGISKDAYRRRKQHLQGQSHWTSRARDWEPVWMTTVGNAAAARVLEKRIKSRGARRFLDAPFCS